MWFKTRPCNGVFYTERNAKKTLTENLLGGA